MHRFCNGSSWGKNTLVVVVVSAWCGFLGLQRRLSSVFCSPGAPLSGLPSARAQGLGQRRLQRAVGAEGKPIELLTLPELDLYTSQKGVVPSTPPLQLPEGKRSLLDGLPPKQVDGVAEASDAQSAAADFLANLTGKTQALDFVTAALLLCALSLGLLDTRRRWLDLLAEELGWLLHSLLPQSVTPARRVAGSRQDTEVADAAQAEVRRLAEFVQTAKAADQLRALSAADAAASANGLLEPLAQALRAAAAASAAEEGDLPSLDGEWECLLDYFTTGELVPAPMRIQGSTGEYRAAGDTHRLSEIYTRRKGSLLVTKFRWRNAGGGRGRGSWMLSGDGSCVDGTWTQDGSREGPWVWTGVRKQLFEPSAMVGRAPPSRTASSVSAGTAAAEAAAAVLADLDGRPAAEQEALAAAWDAAAPQRVGGIWAQSARLPRLWLAAGAELRTSLGLTYDRLVPPPVAAVATLITLATLSALALLLSRALALGLGSSTDAATWALFAASAAVVLDLTLPSRRESLRDSLRTPEQQALRARRLQALRRWADGGALRRSGSAPRGEVLEAVRKGVPEFRMLLGSEEEDSLPSDAEVEQLLRIWHPGLKRRALRGLAGVQAREMQQREEGSGEVLLPAAIVFENLSLAPGSSAQVWR